MKPTDELHDAIAAAGAVFADEAGGAVARHFGDPQDEYRALTGGVGLVDLSRRTRVEMTGGDRARFLNNLCTNDVAKLAPGEGCEAFLTTPQGKIAAYVLVFCGAESIVLESAADQAEAVMAQLDRYLIREDVQLHDRSTEWTEFLVAGAHAERLLSGLGLTVPTPTPLSHADGSCGGRPIRLRRVELTVGGGFLVETSSADGAHVWSVLRDAGATPCGADAFDVARIEAGTPLYGRDVTDENLPQEVDRNERAISLTKGCYVGQETVARIDALGHVNRVLRGVKFSGSPTPSRDTVSLRDTELTRDGKKRANDHPPGHITLRANDRFDLAGRSKTSECRGYLAARRLVGTSQLFLPAAPSPEQSRQPCRHGSTIQTPFCESPLRHFQAPPSSSRPVRHVARHRPAHAAAHPTWLA